MSKAVYEIVEKDDRLFFHDGEQYVLFDSGFVPPRQPRYSASESGKIGPFAASRLPAVFFEEFINLTMDDGGKVTAIFNPCDGYDCLLEGSTLIITDEEVEVPQCLHFLDFVNPSLPIVRGRIDGGEECNLLFDSGARMTMLGEAPRGAQPRRTYIEWMAMLRCRAELPVYPVTLEFADGFRYSGEGAVVTDPAYQTGARMMNFRAILGIDIFKQYDLFIAAKGKRRGIAILEKR